MASNERKHSPNEGRRSRALAVVVGVALLGAGCAVTPIPMSDEETAARIKGDLAVVLAPQEPLTGPVTMSEAMARALRYNLDQRVKLMEMAVADRQLDLSRYDMLPKIVEAAGYTNRDNESGSVSRNLDTGLKTNQSSTSQDPERVTSDLGVTWNILDFGVSYLRARQNADLSLVAAERRRRVVQGIVQDVRTSFWRAVAAERLLGRIAPLEKRVADARRDSRTVESLRVQSPLRALTYQRDLLDTQRQLQSLRRELSPAKSQLAALMGLPPGQDFKIAIPPANERSPALSLSVPLDALETFALINRPELREETLNGRISEDETRRSLLRLLPGIDLNAGLHFDTNSYLVHQQWVDYGAKVSWNLLNLVSAPDLMAYGEATEELVRRRRQALSMAVMSQVRVSVFQFQEVDAEYRLTADQAEIEMKISRESRNAGEAGQNGELEVIQTEARAMLSSLRRDLAYADLQNAYAKTLVSAGVDVLPDTTTAVDVPTLAKSIETSLADWQKRAAATLPLKPDAPRPSGTGS